MDIVNNIPNNIEHWLNIDGYDNYQVSNFGRVRNSTTGRILKPAIARDGYLKVTLYKLNEKRKTCMIHRLVAHEFVDNPNNKREVDHIDRDTRNNHASNLRWACPCENGRNKTIYKNNNSGMKGVSYVKSLNKYRARINQGGTIIHIGYFNTAEEAGRAYDKRAKELDPDFFTLNFND